VLSIAARSFDLWRISSGKFDQTQSWEIDHGLAATETPISASKLQLRLRDKTKSRLRNLQCDRFELFTLLTSQTIVSIL